MHYTHQSRAPEWISRDKYKRKPWVWVYQGEKENNSKRKVHDSKQDLGGLQTEGEVSSEETWGGAHSTQIFSSRIWQVPSLRENNGCPFTTFLNAFLIPPSDNCSEENESNPLSPSSRPAGAMSGSSQALFSSH